MQTFKKILPWLLLVIVAGIGIHYMTKYKKEKAKAAELTPAPVPGLGTVDTAVGGGFVGGLNPLGVDVPMVE